MVMLGKARKEAHPSTIPVDIVGHGPPQFDSKLGPFVPGQ